MAEILAPAVGKPIYNGTHGNLSLATNYMQLKAVAAGTKIKFATIPVGTLYTAVRVSLESLGSGVTLDVAVRDSEGNEKVLKSAITGNTAATHVIGLAPTYVGDEGPSDLLLHVKGAAATGRVDVGLEYIAEGY